MNSNRFRHSALEILNCGRNASKDEISQALNKIGLGNFVKLTKAQNEAKCRVTFKNDEEKNNAMNIISSNPTVTDEAEGPWKVKSVFMKRVHISKEKKEAIEQKTAADAVAPWRNIPYTEQLEKKQKEVQEAISTWTESMKLSDYEFRNIVSSPVIDAYRNKLDFTIGRDSSGKPCVGFRVGSFKEGGSSSFRVEVSDECLFTSPKIGLELAKFLSDFIQTESSLPVYDQEKHEGFWRAFSIRYSDVTKQLMVILRCATHGEAGEQEKKKVIEYLKRFQHEGIKISSMYWQYSDEIAFQAAPEENLEYCFGEQTIEENVLGMKFNVSVGAFFQVNTRGCEVLFEKVRNILNNQSHKNLLLLDICCGTGVIGLLCANSAKYVIGIELSNPAVEDARKNADTNSLQDKTTFICSKAESVLSQLLTGEAKRQLSKKDTVLSELDESALQKALQEAKACDEIVAIVDPPRAGLHPSVLKALLRCSAVERIIYVSCNPTGSFIENAKALCGPMNTKKKDSQETEDIVPFIPVQFIPVDMFPHTDHCELIAEFVRKPKIEHEISIATDKRAKIEEEHS